CLERVCNVGGAEPELGCLDAIDLETLLWHAFLTADVDVRHPRDRGDEPRDVARELLENVEIESSYFYGEAFIRAQDSIEQKLPFRGTGSNFRARNLAAQERTEV